MSNLERLGRKFAAPLIGECQPPFETVGRWHRQLGRISLATGHNANLISEVTQVGGLALAWLTQHQNGTQA